MKEKGKKKKNKKERSPFTPLLALFFAKIWGLCGGGGLRKLKPSLKLSNQLYKFLTPPKKKILTVIRNKLPENWSFLNVESFSSSYGFFFSFLFDDV